MQMKRLGGLILKILPFAVIAVLIAAIIASGKELSFEAILSYMPENLWVAALLIMMMYGLKSLSVIFPLIALQIAAGLVFPVWQALILNIIGTGFAYTVPYAIGRVSGAPAAEKLMKKYPKIRGAIDAQRNSAWFPSFVLRAVSCLPADIVSMYLGSIEIPFVPYVTASVAGTLPGLIPATVAGTSLSNPKSPAFIISVFATVLTSIASVWLYRQSLKRSR